MNNIAVQGYLRDIEFSHDIGNIDYEKAKIICPGINGKEDDLLFIQFKKFSNRYKEGDFIEFKGNIRSYNVKKEDGKSSVQIYIFTYFDLPDIPVNTIQIDGRICKITPLIKGKKNTSLHFILANNIFKNNFKLNSYIPCTAHGELAEQLADCQINDFITVDGELHSHTYKRKTDNEIILAHDVTVKQFQIGKKNG